MHRRDILTKMYGVKEWEDSEDFLKQVATRKGKLRKGGEPDTDMTAKLVLIDWQRGDIPYFNLPEGEVDKFQAKQEETIQDVKEEELYEMAGVEPPQQQEEPIEEEEEEEEGVERFE